mgnify:CR=1 FL=1
MDKYNKAEQDALWQVCTELAEEADKRKTNLQDDVSVLEINEIARALRVSDNNQTNAAKLLHLNRTTLLAKMRKYDL